MKIDEELPSFYTDEVIIQLTKTLDYWRASLLRLTLRSQTLREIYQWSHLRHPSALFIQTLIYLPLAFARPDLLLVFGPLIFGYTHLIASFRFTPTHAQRSFWVLALVTAVCIALHLSQMPLPNLGQLPFGSWQMLCATFALLVLETLNWKRRVLALGLCTLFLVLTWQQPLLSVGGMLLLHNWVAFLTWIKLAPAGKRKQAALLSTSLFFLVHLFVLLGFLDGWIPMEAGVVNFPGRSQMTAWLMASWSEDPLVWYRLLVLYVFGLALHYYVWLKAIPESQSPYEHPHSFRMVFTKLKADLGLKAFVFTLLLTVLGMTLWLVDRPLGARVYFEVALLHGAVELMFLIKNKS